MEILNYNSIIYKVLGRASVEIEEFFTFGKDMPCNKRVLFVVLSLLESTLVCYLDLFINFPDVVMSFCPDYPAVQVLHPTQCAQFYDCSNMNSLPNQPAYLNECPYPKLFNDQTLRCEDYASVDCGDRAEPLSPCKNSEHSKWFYYLT